MRKLLAVIVALMVLGAAVPGCRHALRYDGRLAAADSLMRDYPDSALAMLEALSPGDLHTGGDSAYRDLLLTQARYRAYVSATSDSDINLALAWFRAHPADREKLTRAYIYKGAVMEELSKPDSAMLYYKHAEATAAPDDYFNLGYCKMRMGALYRDNYSMDGRHISKYEEALECFNRTDNFHYQLVCMINLGSLYCLKSPEKADSLLKKSLTLAEQLGDSINYVSAAQNIIKNYLNQGRIHAAQSVVQNVLCLRTSHLSIPFCLYAAKAYALLQQPDSAQIFLNLIKGTPLTNEYDVISGLEARRDIALARGDTSLYLKLNNACKFKSDSLQSLDASFVVLQTEDQIDNQTKLSSIKSKQASNHWILALILLFFLILLVAVYSYYKRRKSYNKELTRLNKLIEVSGSEINEMKQSLEKLNKLEVKDNKLIVFLNSYMDLMRDFMEECYHEPNKRHTQRMKKIIEFQNANKEKWEKLYGFIDLECSGIITKTKINYPQLNDKDLLLIALSAMDFSCIQIAIIMGYSNQTSVGTIRKRLCEKMNLEGTFNDYISQFK